MTEPKPDAGALDLPRTEILNRLMDILKAPAGGQNILLAGPWGSGKTTLLGKLKKNLNQETFYPIEFSPWEQLADEDPREGFLKLLGAEILRLEADKENTKRINGLKGDFADAWAAGIAFAKDMEKEITDAVKDLPGGSFALVLAKLTRCLLNQHAVSKQTAATAVQSVTPRTKDLRTRFGTLLRAITQVAGRERCLLLVEDLDRTRPEYAIGILDGLYHLFMPTTRPVTRRSTAYWYP